MTRKKFSRGRTVNGLTRSMGILPMVHVRVHFGAAEPAIAPAKRFRSTFARAIASRLRHVREYTHHGLEAHDTTTRSGSLASRAPHGRATLGRRPLAVQDLNPRGAHARRRVLLRQFL